MYGFGAIPRLDDYSPNEIEFCFPLTGKFNKPEVYGLEGVMNLYKKTLPQLEFGGPCNLSEIIEYSKMVAEKNQEKDVYTILVILTCGNIHDKTKTLDMIKQCNKVPISIIIVGIGEGDFSILERLD
jgi:hypothetical protein